MPKFSDNMPEKMSQMQKQLDNMVFKTANDI